MDGGKSAKRGSLRRGPADIGRRTLAYWVLLFICVVLLYVAFFSINTPENLAKLIYTQLAQPGEAQAPLHAEKCNPPARGQWNVVDSETCRQVTISLSGDLVVESVLTLYNTTLIINSTKDGEHSIIVKPGGTLIAYNSRISSAGAAAYLFRAEQGSTLVLQDSEVRGAGYDLGIQGELAGLYILTDNAKLERTVFRNNYIGASFRNSKGADVTGSRFQDNVYGVRISNSQPVISGSTFNNQIFDIYTTDFSSGIVQDSDFSPAKVVFGDSESNLSVQRTATFQVENSAGAPLDNATLFIYDEAGNAVGQSVTVNGTAASPPLLWLDMSANGSTYHTYGVSTSFENAEGPHATIDFAEGNRLSIVFATGAPPPELNLTNITNATNETIQFNFTNGTNFTLPELNISLNLTNITENFTPNETGRILGKGFAPPKRAPRKITAAANELTGERTPLSRKFSYPDGEQTAVIFPVPVQYLAQDGNWYSIDTRITQSEEPGYAYEVSANPFQAYFSDNSSQDLVKVRKGEASLAFSLDQSQEAAMELNGSTLEYNGIDDGVDVAYTVTARSVKEQIVLSNASVRRRFDFNLTLDGFDAKRMKDGSYLLVDQSTGIGIFTIQKPFAVDSGGAVSANFGMSLVRKGAGYALTITPDNAWLNAPSRAYPVFIDPTIVLNTSDPGADDTYIDDAFAAKDVNYGQVPQIYVSYVAGTCSGPPACLSHLDKASCEADVVNHCLWTGDIQRSMLKFNLTSIPADSIINEANLSVNLESDSYSASVLVAAHQIITSNWTEDNASWTNNSANYNATAENKTTVNGASAGRYVFNITNLLNGWYQGTMQNYGVMLKRDSESGTNSKQAFSSSEGVTATNVPNMTVRYTVGTQCTVVNGNYSMNSSVSSSGTCYIINASNIVFNCRGYTITGSGTGAGILVNVSNVNITNCNIIGFEYQVLFTPAYGIASVAQTAHFVVNGSFSNTGGELATTHGIYINRTNGVRIWNASLSSSKFGILLNVSSDVQLSNISISSTGLGIVAFNGRTVLVDNSSIFGQVGKGGFTALLATNMTDFTVNNTMAGGFSASAFYFLNSTTVRIQNSSTRCFVVGVLPLYSRFWLQDTRNASLANNSVIRDSTVDAAAKASMGEFFLNNSWNATLGDNIVSGGDTGYNIFNSSNVSGFNLVVSSLTSNAGLLLNSTNNSFFFNITAVNNTGYGVYLVNSYNNTLANITSINNSLSGIYLTSSSNNTFENLTVGLNDRTQTGVGGIYLAASHNNSFSNATVYGHALAGTSFGIGGSVAAPSRYNRFYNSTLRNNTMGLYFADSGNSFNEFYNVSISNSSSYGIWFRRSGSNLMVNCSVTDAPTTSIIYVSNGVSNNTLVNTTVDRYNVTVDVGSSLMLDWYSRAEVYGCSGGVCALLDAAWVNTTNNTFTQVVYNQTTSGYTNWSLVREGFLTSTGFVSSNNYSFNVSKSGYTSNYTNASINLTSHQATIYLLVPSVPATCGNLTANYTMTGNLFAPKTCFNVSTDNLTLDCAGYSLIGAGAGGYAAVFNPQFDNFTVKNCIISNFTYGIVYNTSANNGTIYNTTIWNVTLEGIYLNNSNATIISSVNVQSSTGQALELAGTSFFTNAANSSFNSTGTAINFSSATGGNSNFYNVTATSITTAINIAGSDVITFSNVTSNGTRTAFLATSTTTYVTLINFTAISTNGPAVNFSGSSSLTNIHIINSSLYSSGTYDLALQATSATLGPNLIFLLNTTFNRSDIGWNGAGKQNISVMWYGQALVINQSGTPQQGVSVVITNSSGTVNYTGITGADGYLTVQANLSEFYANGSFVYNGTSQINVTFYTNPSANYTFTAYGTQQDSTNATLNESRSVTLTIPGTGGSSCGILMQNTTLNNSVAATAGTCFTIANTNVTLDCAGFGITGMALPDSSGVFVNNSINASIKNCVITNFFFAIRINVSNMTSVRNITASQIVEGLRFEGNTASTAPAARNNISNSSFSSTGAAINISDQYGTNNSFDNLTLSSSSTAISIAGSDYLDFRNVTATGTRTAFLATSTTTYVTLTNFTAISTTGPAVNLSYRSSMNNIHIINSSLRSSGNYDLAIQSTSTSGPTLIFLLNTTFNRSNIGWNTTSTGPMNMTVMWYGQVLVNNQSGSPQQGVSVVVTNSSGTVNYTGITGADGYLTIPANLSEFYANGSFVYNGTSQQNVTFYTNPSLNYTFTAYGTQPNSTNATLNESRILTLTVQPGGSSCGYLLQNTTLNNSVVATAGTCFTIANTNVTLDCAGFGITGMALPDSSGVFVNNSINATIRNCIIQNFAYGIRLNTSNMTSARNITASQIVEGLRIEGNTLAGSPAALNNISNSSFSSTGAAINISDTYGSNNSFDNLTLSSSSTAISIAGSDYLDFRNVTATGTRTAFLASSSTTYVTFTNFTAVSTNGPAVNLTGTSTFNNIYIINSSLYSSGNYDLAIQSTSTSGPNLIFLLNTTFNRSDIGWSTTSTGPRNMTVMWYGQVLANNQSGTPQQGVSVVITNSSGTVNYTGITGADGYLTIPANLSEFYANGSFVYNGTSQINVTFYTNPSTNYTFTAYGTQPNSTNATLNESRVLTLTVQPGGSSCGILMQNTTLNNSVVATAGTCFTIANTNVTLDCAGFGITGMALPDSSGVFVNNSINSTIENCIIQNFFYGVRLNSSNMTSVRNITASQTMEGLRIEGNTLSGTPAVLNNISNSSFSSTGAAINISDTYGSNNSFDNLSLSSSSTAIYINGADYLDFRNVTATGTYSAFMAVATTTYVTFTNFTAVSTNGPAVNLSRSGNTLNNIHIINSSLYSSGTYDIALQTTGASAGPNLIFLLNTTFNRSDIGWNSAGGKLNMTVMWSPAVNVTNQYGAPLSGASVNISATNGSIFYGLTGADGYISQALNFTEFFAKGPFIYNYTNDTNVTFYTPHQFTANKTNYFTNSTNYTINESIPVTLILQSAVAGVTCGTITNDTTMLNALTATGTCFTIGADNVTLDCDNYAVTGDGTGFGVINPGYGNVTVTGCIISNFSYGIAYTGGALNGTIRNDVVYNTSMHGIFVNASSNYTRIFSSRANKSSDVEVSAPIVVSGSSHVNIANVTTNASGMGRSIYVNSSENVSITNSTAVGGLSAIYAEYSLNLTVNYTTAEARGNGGTALYVSWSNSTSILNSNATSASGYGIDVENSNSTLISLSSATTSAPLEGSGAGIQLSGANYTTISATNTTTTAYKQALSASSSYNLSILHSTASSGEDGIRISSSPYALVQNTTSTGTLYALATSGSDFLTVRNTTLQSGSQIFNPSNSNNFSVSNSTFIAGDEFVTGASIAGSSNGTIVNSSIINVSFSDAFDGTVITNTTFDRAHISFSTPKGNLTVKWYLNFTVDDISGNPVASASVNGTPIFGGDALFNGTTDAQGDIWGLTEFTEFIANGSFAYNFVSQANYTPYNNYTFYASKTNYFTNYTNATVNQSRTLNLYLRSFPQCGDVLTSSTTLLSDVNSTGTCFVINGTNVVLDCAGFAIRYANTTTSSWGVFVNGSSNAIIKNCYFEKTNSSGISAAILVNRSNNATIYNNTIYALGTTNYGIWVRNSSDSTNITNNSAITGARSIYLDTSANRTWIDQDYLNASLAGTSGYTMYFDNAPNTSVRNTIASANIGALYATNSRQLSVGNSTLNVTTSNGDAISILGASHNYLIFNSTATASPAIQANAISVTASDYGIIANSTLWGPTYSVAGCYPLALVQSNYTNITNVSAFGRNLFMAVYLSGSMFDRVESSFINDSGLSGSYAAIYLEGQNHTIQNNQIISRMAGIGFSGSAANITIQNNSINATGNSEALNLIWPAGDIFVLYNNVTDPSSDCLTMSSGSERFTIMWNNFYGCSTGISLLAGNSLVANNTINASGIAFTLGALNGTIQNNTINSSGTVAFSISAQTVQSSVRIINNTIQGGSGGAAVSFGNVAGLYFANNTIIGLGANSVSTASGSINNTNFTGDLIIGGSGATSDAIDLTKARDIVFTNVTIRVSKRSGIYASGTSYYGNITVINSSIQRTGAGSDIYLSRNTNFYFINTTLNRTNITLLNNANITVQWLVDVNVTNISSQGEANAGVNITDSQGTVLFQGLTGSNGYISPTQNLTELRANGTFIYNGANTLNVTYYSYYSFNATKDGYTSNFTNATVNESKAITIVLAVTPIGTTCGTLTTDTSMTNALTSAGTCFTIGSHNITLDCAGFSITGDTTGFGVINVGYQNVTVKNCIISAFNYGIAYTGSALNGTILNNSVSASGMDSILVNSSSNFTQVLFSRANITNNEVWVGAIHVNGSSHVIIANSSANATGPTAINVEFSQNVTVANSTGRSQSGSGIRLSYSNNATILNSTSITEYGEAIYIQFSNSTYLSLAVARSTHATTSSYGLRIVFSHFSTLSNLTSSSQASSGIYIQSSNLTTLANSTATASSGSGNAIYVTSSNNLTVTNSTASGPTGIYFASSHNATISNSTLSGSGRSVTFDTGSRQDTIVNSSIASGSTSAVYSTAGSGNNSIVNTTFDRTKVGWGTGANSINNNLTVKWYVNFSVRDNVGSPVAGAGVNGTPIFGGDALFNGTTDAQGDIWGLTEFTEFIANGSFIYNTSSQQNYTTYNNYTFYANKTNSLTSFTNLTINFSQNITLFLVPATCGIAANATSMNFGSVETGVQTDAISIGISNTGTIPTSVYASGTVWANETYAQTMPVDRSHYNTTDSSSAWATWTPLSASSVNISNVSVGVQIPVYWRALVPSGTPAYVFTQNVTYSTVC